MFAQTKKCNQPVQQAITESIVERFESLQKYGDLFPFLYDFENIEEGVRNGSLLKSCKELENALAFNGKVDIDSDELHSELIIVASLMKTEKAAHIMDILNTIQKLGMENVVPNFVMAMWILLTVPVSGASGERSFSKLKIVKNYLRNNMNEEGLNELSIIAIWQMQFHMMNSLLSWRL